ncbi:TetR/AcrR family transcriptional regulator [Seonamhaeicola marinus]|uniref:TetR/AcrR family transcriptional regulator n=1 Tax=Seonamhaeicola marinus TaxID=1912246 RepID=A0A5D0HJZ1_9FLAO|nr:TetR/AcrR family transcriptional regulator [Seonamhaeicola marinus]TYA71616.1 TetR/AcrR family transcriptional regulator [Seonamhaeicola marinus]
MNKNYTETGRTLQKQKTRNNILTSAKKLLQKGKDFTLEDIAEDANISRATIYRYYSSVDVLSLEAGLDWQTKSPEEVLEPLNGLNTQQTILGIQDYFNNLAYNNEKAFRKYLSHAITTNSEEGKRGARRVKTLSLALQNNNLNLSEEDSQKLIVAATTLMGVEALIVTKDVCGLNNETSKSVLNWALEQMLKGILS